MWDTVQKLRYRADAGIAQARRELEQRLTDRIELPLRGLHGEKLYLTGVEMLQSRARELDVLYTKLPERRGVKDTILLDAWSSATIEGARTTVAKVKESITNPQTRDDRMVVNAVKGADYAFRQPISEKNIRRLWERVVDGVCENAEHRGRLYRDGMVYIGSTDRVIHTPAAAEQLPQLMRDWFAFCEPAQLHPLLNAFAAHFYFVYAHPFCDGNGRTARILNISQLYHSGYKKIKSISLSNAINQQLSGYYSTLTDSERVQQTDGEAWLDLSPFVSYMLDAFERSMMNASLSGNSLNEQEIRLLNRMNKAGAGAEITVRKASQVLKLSDSRARAVLNALAQKGYLQVDTSHTPYIYRMHRIP